MIIFNKNNEKCTESDYGYCSFDYPLDEFQKHALSSIKKDRNVLVCAATGNGKTSVAIGAIKLSYLENKRVIYTAPIKALLNQKYSEFRKAFDDVGIETGDVKINPSGQCVVMTTEVLRNKLLLNDIEVLKDVKCVIFDEVHYIKDPSRGNVWETCISMLNVQQVMLSATIKGPELFAQWIQEVQPSRDLHLIEVTQRKVPLDYYWYTDKELIHIMDNEKNFDSQAYSGILNSKWEEKNDLRKLNEAVLLLKQKDLFPATFFVMSKKNCEHYATKVTIPLIDSEGSSNAVNEFNFLLQRDQELEKQSLQVELLRKLVAKGIGMHHAGLNPLLKEIIEILYSKGYLRVLFATGTFTVGLNMPIRTVVLTGLDVYSELHQRVVPFGSDEFIQMCGRAGRRGLDKRGYVVVCLLRNSEKPLLHELKNMMTNPPDSVSSKMHIDTNIVIDLLKNGKNLEEIINFFAKSMHGNEVRSEINALELVLSDGPPTFEFVSKDFDKYLELREKVQKPLRQNQLKKLKMSMEQLLQRDNMAETVKRYEVYLLEKNAYEGTKSSLEHLKSCDKDLVLCCLKDLEHRGYILEDVLTTKGHIASCINGYDKIVLTELITGSYMTDLSVCEIGVLLAFFIKFSGDVELYQIEHISYLYDYLMSMDATVYISFAPLVYQWLNDIKYGAIEGVDSYSEGNFITQMNLLVQLVDNLINVCEDYEFHILMKKLSELRILLRRDIVITQSLHL